MSALLLRVCVQMPNVLGLLFALAQMALYFVYRNRNPKKNGAVSEMQQQAAVQADADAEKEQQPRQAHADATNVQCMIRERKID